MRHGRAGIEVTKRSTTGGSHQRERARSWRLSLAAKPSTACDLYESRAASLIWFLHTHTRAAGTTPSSFCVNKEKGSRVSVLLRNFPLVLLCGLI